jgi:hypothetical protein
MAEGAVHTNRLASSKHSGNPSTEALTPSDHQFARRASRWSHQRRKQLPARSHGRITPNREISLKCHDYLVIYR